VTLVAMAVTIGVGVGVALSGSDGATEWHVPDARDH
jgi:hypothetical protein